MRFHRIHSSSSSLILLLLISFCLLTPLLLPRFTLAQTEPPSTEQPDGGESTPSEGEGELNPPPSGEPEGGEQPAPEEGAAESTQLPGLDALRVTLKDPSSAPIGAGIFVFPPYRLDGASSVTPNQIRLVGLPSVVDGDDNSLIDVTVIPAVPSSDPEAPQTQLLVQFKAPGEASTFEDMRGMDDGLGGRVYSDLKMVDGSMLKIVVQVLKEEDGTVDQAATDELNMSYSFLIQHAESLRTSSPSSPFLVEVLVDEVASAESSQAGEGNLPDNPAMNSGSNIFTLKYEMPPTAEQVEALTPVSSGFTGELPTTPPLHLRLTPNSREQRVFLVRLLAANTDHADAEGQTKIVPVLSLRPGSEQSIDAFWDAMGMSEEAMSSVNATSILDSIRQRAVDSSVVDPSGYRVYRWDLNPLYQALEATKPSSDESGSTTQQDTTALQLNPLPLQIIFQTTSVDQSASVLYPIDFDFYFVTPNFGHEAMLVDLAPRVVVNRNEEALGRVEEAIRLAASGDQATTNFGALAPALRQWNASMVRVVLESTVEPTFDPSGSADKVVYAWKTAVTIKDENAYVASENGTKNADEQQQTGEENQLPQEGDPSTAAPTTIDPAVWASLVQKARAFVFAQLSEQDPFQVQVGGVMDVNTPAAAMGSSMESQIPAERLQQPDMIRVAIDSCVGDGSSSGGGATTDCELAAGAWDEQALAELNPELSSTPQPLILHFPTRGTMYSTADLIRMQDLTLSNDGEQPAPSSPAKVARLRVSVSNATRADEQSVRYESRHELRTKTDPMFDPNGDAGTPPHQPDGGEPATGEEDGKETDTSGGIVDDPSKHGQQLDESGLSSDTIAWATVAVIASLAILVGMYIVHRRRSMNYAQYSQQRDGDLEMVGEESGFGRGMNGPPSTMNKMLKSPRLPSDDLDETALNMDEADLEAAVALDDNGSHLDHGHNVVTHEFGRSDLERQTRHETDEDAFRKAIEM